MDVSIFLAKAFSLYFLIVGITIIVRRKMFQDMVTEFFANKPLIFLMALITLILGILLVIAHPMFTADWRSLITIIAYLTLIKGIVHLFAPEVLMTFKERLFSRVFFYYVSYLGGLICLILAIYLGYHGFFA